MRFSAISVLLLAVASLVCISGVSRADGLVGLWRTETGRISPSGNTNNMVEAYETVEFDTNGSFTITDVIKGKDGKDIKIPMGGTYTMIDTNHVRLELTPNAMQPSAKIPLAVPFAISGDQLEMVALTASVVPETKKYRRVKQ